MAKTLKDTLNKSMSEKEFQRLVIEAAQINGWYVAHFRTAQAKSGNYITPVQADGAGFPDLVLVKNERLIFAELKAERGRMSAAQSTWFHKLGKVAFGCNKIGVVIWHPSDLDDIIRILT